VDAPSLPVGGAPARGEPFVYGAVPAAGGGVTGTPVPAGIGGGRVVVVDNPADAGDVDRAIIVARRPIPALASLLWRAAGLVTEAGSAAAHLFEVAASVGVPTVVDLDVEAQLGVPLDRVAAGATVAAINGTSGHLWFSDTTEV